MQVTLVHVRVFPEHIEAFKEACRENHEASVTEPGNRRFDILQSRTDSSRFILYEAYSDAHCAARHKDTPHYLKWRETVAPWMAEPRVGESFHGLFPTE